VVEVSALQARFASFFAAAPMKHILLQPDFHAWRDAAREALRAGLAPSQVDFQDASVSTPLSLELEADDLPLAAPILQPHVPSSFLRVAELVAMHRDPKRWNLLYRVLFRVQNERNLLKIETDEDVAQLIRFEAQIKRDLHKMHAFVRFRKVLEPGNPAERPVVLDEAVPVDPDPEAHHLVLATPTPFGAIRSELEPCDPPTAEAESSCEHYIAWYQPDHRILPLAAPFFAERFSILRWTIITPDASAAWDPATRQVTYGPGLPRESAPADDELETLWRGYYASIFNPARLNPETMRSEMPVRYWKNLPEVTILPNLITQARGRVATMVSRQQQQSSAQSFVPEERSVEAIRRALPACKGCELYCNATQVVPGDGPATSRLMLVGEQPGDQEDRQGLPFVGPAGQLLRRAMDEVEIDPATIYLTNAVKHFKYVQRGKLRLHMNPRMSEITACRPWLQAEIEAVKPKVILCLGASASKSLLGGTFALMQNRGKLMKTPFADQVMATVHPSAVLRARDAEQHQQLYQFLRDDLALARELIQK
jgi:uracil-DNA glycosylase family protein